MAGAVIRDIEFIQFHPTALVLNSETKNRYLISEALRGEGATLINNNGEAFMSQYSEKKELAQRDIVARAIFAEMKKENKPNVFLTTNKINHDILRKRFPSIYKKCLTNGIDITKNPIPVAPAAHYTIGGIQTNISGQTSVKGLYAIGEVASTGFHGANRLASNSLLECIVCAKKLAEDIEIKKTEHTPNIDKTVKKYDKMPQCDQNNYQILKDKLKDIMWYKVGITRNEKDLVEATNEINNLKENIKNINCFSSITGYEFRNMLIAAELITKCAITRKESRGAHYRSDYPDASDNPQHSYLNKHTVG